MVLNATHILQKHRKDIENKQILSPEYAIHRTPHAFAPLLLAIQLCCLSSSYSIAECHLPKTHPEPITLQLLNIVNTELGVYIQKQWQHEIAKKKRHKRQLPPYTISVKLFTGAPLIFRGQLILETCK